MNRLGRIAIVAVSVLGLTAGSAWGAPVAWPGGSSVATADGSNVFGENLSGLSFQSASVVWAVKNGPGKAYRLVPDGAGWKPDPSAGKTLRYANGKGDPDAEGVVASPDGIVVATERDNSDNDNSLLKVLRYDGTSSASTLNATREWNLTSDLPDVDSNSGLEGISWVPDSFLTAHGFRDEHTGTTYDPATYAGHGTGLYFVGLEDNGVIYAYALNQSSSSYTRVATIASGFSEVMDLEFDAGTGRLWAACDDGCSGRTTTLEINTAGKFAPTATYNRPSGMANLNNEGFAISPTCTSGTKTVLWSDDSNTSNHALRRGTLPCSS
ncbi:hypothetical protein ACIA49_12350 [Kribbella sp. NPDC051587]|uniref:hypothetical protein n=1 Tax=Kribbella sp. NPDC051587 TaxID=3364119 RepID=UPI0037B4FD29